jgi:hypothetical protein
VGRGVLLTGIGKVPEVFLVTVVNEHAAGYGGE